MSQEASKAELRARFRRRVAHPDDARASEAIVDRLARLEECGGSGAVMLYLATAGEPNLDALIPRLRDAGVRVCGPRVEWVHGTMEPAEIVSLDELVCRQHGVREPAAEAPVVPIEDLRVVVVPGVVFDERGSRLGRGGGFYDRFLARLDRATMRVGAAFERQVVEHVPTDPWDQRLDVLVTESAVRRFERAEG